MDAFFFINLHEKHKADAQIKKGKGRRVTQNSNRVQFMLTPTIFTFFKPLKSQFHIILATYNPVHQS